MRSYNYIRSSVFSLSLILSLAIMSPSAFTEGIDEINLEKATREVDKETIPENFKWVSRKKAEIRKESGELIEDPNDVDQSSVKNASEDFPPCAPCQLPRQGKR